MNPSEMFTRPPIVQIPVDELVSTHFSDTTDFESHQIVSVSFTPPQRLQALTVAALLINLDTYGDNMRRREYCCTYRQTTSPELTSHKRQEKGGKGETVIDSLCAVCAVGGVRTVGGRSDQLFLDRPWARRDSWWCNLS